MTGQPFKAEDARAALRAAVPDLDRRERAHQIEITDSESWYASGAQVQPRELVDALVRRGEQAVEAGYQGLRTSGNCSWVSKEQWPDFLRYEDLVQKASRNRRMISLCSYCADQVRGGGQANVMCCHDLAIPSTLVRAEGSAEMAAVPASWQRQKRTFDLAMTASHMGTWRYTVADHICLYDENAQRLYGLTEAAFVHDEAGVRGKFHPDDLERMWARVAKALDPRGDGAYDVEYRVMQRDGQWRWLSAWGLTEFEGEGTDRKAVAISGASRDLTERKEIEQHQQFLVNELNHRVKNTLATIQAITAQTLRGAADLPSARAALEHRLHAMARAHDLLTASSWHGALLADVVRQAFDAFATTQADIEGPAVTVSSRHALALSLALHELATNATKYGALSVPAGRVRINWTVAAGTLNLHWIERGGPAVTPPTHKGFGSRLLEVLIAHDLNGATTLDYAVDGVRCHITAPL